MYLDYAEDQAGTPYSHDDAKRKIRTGSLAKKDIIGLQTAKYTPGEPNFEPLSIWHASR
jgi:hypothetical protein